MKRKLISSTAFTRAARKYLKKRPNQTENLQMCLLQLEEDAFQHSLRTHKLTGPLSDSWAASAGYDLRIIFKFVKHEESEAILLETVGTHDEVY
ncbi:MAG: plasmid stabilization protein [Deltaproteobacteria bacterium]|nr:plasmid stabilization protein [Deltaproteobacteria bacterium]